MSQGRKEPGQRGGRPEGGPAMPSSGPARGGSASQMSWAIVSANVVALLALVLAVVGLVLQFTDEDEGGGAAVAAKPTATVKASPVVQATPTPVVVQGVSVDDDPSKGPDDAPVTIVMFTDYQ